MELNNPNSNPSSTSNDGANVGAGNVEQILLAISTSLTNNEDRADLRPVDEERKKFLFNAINNAQISHEDDIEAIKRCLAQLQNNVTDVESCILAMEDIMNRVCHIDAASDFVKLSGFKVIREFLRSKNKELVRLAAEIIGISAQNNPIAQKAVVNDDQIFLDLFSILKSPDQEDSVKTKAVFAISSTIQNNKRGHDTFLKLSGYDEFLHILKNAGTPLRLRICFVIDCLCSQFPQIKSILLEKGYIDCLTDMLSKIPISESKETVLSSLMTVVEGCYDAIRECNKEEYNLKPTLDYLITHYTVDDAEEKSQAIKLRNELDRFT